MKNKLFLFLTILFIPVIANAENLKAGNNNYSIKKIESYCENFNLHTLGYLKNDIVCVDYTTEKLYYVNSEGVKKELSSQEYLDVYNMNMPNYMLDFVDGVGPTKDILKVNNAVEPGFVKVKYEDIDQDKLYATITKEDNGHYTFNYSNEQDFTFDPNVTYYEVINIDRPKKATLENITYYTTDDHMIYNVVKEPKVEDIKNYYVLYEKNGFEKVGEISDKLFDKVTEVSSEIHSTTIFIDKLPSKNVFYISYSEETYNSKQSWLFDMEGNVLLENVDIAKVINDDLLAVKKDDVVKIYSIDMTELTTLNIVDFEIIYTDNYQTVFRVEDGSLYNIKKITTLSKDNQQYDNKDLILEFSGDKEEINAIKINDQDLNQDNYVLGEKNTTIILKDSYLKTLATGTYTISVEYKDNTILKTTFNIPEKIVSNPIIDLTNPDTGDTIIISVILGAISVIGIVAVTKHKRKEN